MVDTLPISLKDIEAAAARIEGAVVHTPANRSQTLSDITGADIWLKFEIFQFTASFKERGALNRLLALDESERQRGVIAMSAGNHAQGVAYHARRLGIPATIVMPQGTPFSKVKSAEDLGASVELVGGNLMQAAAHAKDLADSKGFVFVHPYDDPLIIAGQGTVGLEFMRQCPDLDTLVVPVGGGGLISGVAIAACALKPDIRVIGVQSEAYPGMKAALAGEVCVPAHNTIAEGIAVKDPGLLTREIVRQRVADILVVNETAIETALATLLEIEKVVVEGAAAATLAAVTTYPDEFRGRKVGLVLSGGNIDARALTECLIRGLVRDGRISRLRVTVGDSPGSLAKVTEVVARARGNVIEIAHRRHFASVHPKETEIELEIETKDQRHTEAVVESLQQAGFDVSKLGSP